jgi:hypothetical protein
MTELSTDKLVDGPDRRRYGCVLRWFSDDVGGPAIGGDALHIDFGVFIDSAHS